MNNSVKLFSKSFLSMFLFLLAFVAVIVLSILIPQIILIPFQSFLSVESNIILSIIIYILELCGILAAIFTLDKIDYPNF